MPAEVGQLSRLNRRGTVALQNVAVVAGAPMRWRLRVRQSSAAFFLKIQGEFSWIFDAVLHFDEKSDGFFSVDCAVIVTEGEIHHRANFHFSVHRDWPRHDFVHAQDTALWRILYLGFEQRPLHSAVCGG